MVTLNKGLKMHSSLWLGKSCTSQWLAALEYFNLRSFPTKPNKKRGNGQVSVVDYAFI